MICFVNLSIKFCIDSLKVNDRRAGSSADVEHPALFLMMHFYVKNEKIKYGKESGLLCGIKRMFCPFFLDGVVS